MDLRTLCAIVKHQDAMPNDETCPTPHPERAPQQDYADVRWALSQQSAQEAQYGLSAPTLGAKTI